MPKCGIFINFVFCRELLKNERIPAEKKQKEDKAAVCVVTQFLCVATHNSSCQRNYVAASKSMSQQGLVITQEWVAIVKFSITIELEEDFEESMSGQP